MTEPGPEQKLPPDLLARATLRGREYAWALPDIPLVIEAARAANLVSIGGQLQFRIPDDGTCECYWIEVDTYKTVDSKLPWDERVSQTAAVALRDFAMLKQRFDFVAEGMKGFAKHLKAFTAAGGNLDDAMCFVWYLHDETSLSIPSP
ncbi:MAG: hypothetical protein ACK4X1_13215 [Terricaulis sp.]